MRHLVVVLVSLASTGAHAERRVNALHLDVHRDPCVFVRTDQFRWVVGAGVSTGWETLLDVHVRNYVTHDLSIGLRGRVNRDDVGAGELHVGYALGEGRLMFPGYVVTYTRLVLDGHAGVMRWQNTTLLTASAGLALRLMPRQGSWFEVELAVRESWVPVKPATAFTTPAMGFERTHATEVGFAVSVLWPPRRRGHDWGF